MSDMVNIYDRGTRKKSAVLQNAFDIVETHELNEIYTLTFSLPANDPKTQFCQPRHYVRYGDSGELYRIKSPKVNTSNTSVITYECEHVITTLCDDIMFGSFTYGGAGVKTSAVITWILNQQKTKNWVLGTCGFDRRFEYNWEQENLLNALYSIPKEFAKPYKWSFDTTVYPWRLNLTEIDPEIKPEYYLRASRNLLSSDTSADYANICTRIYPLGYGEGVNQLDIKEVNDGLPYIQSPDDIVAKYGIVEKVLVDRRFENAESLKAYAQSMLELYQTPSMSRSFDVTDIYPLTSQSWDDAEVGKICRMTEDSSTAYITRVSRQLDKAGDLHINLSTKATDIAQNVADLADRIRIESVYAQGATQLYQHSKDANATPKKGMVLSLYFPEEMKQINKVLMRLKLNKFRSYSQTTDSNGGYTQKYTISEKSQEITSQTNTGDSSVTVRVSAQTITSQTNTEDSSVLVSIGAQEITSQTNIEDSSVAVQISAQEITSQTNTGDETVNVTLAENVATTQMTADEGANITTTNGGGGTGTTSASVGYNTISGNVTSDAVWSTTGEFVETNTGSAQFTEDYYEYEYDKSSWTGNTDPSFATEVYGHYHPFYRPFHHHHQLYNIWATLELKKLAHSHTINLDGVGSHSHGFTMAPHNHKINIGHQHKVTIPATTIKVPCPKHKHTVKLNPTTIKVPCPKHKHTVNINATTIKVPCPKHTHTVSINPTTVQVPCPKHKHSITIPGHTHELNIPPHTHGIAAGIFESGNPTGFDIYVNGTKKTTVNANNYNDDITQWLLNAQNQVPRNTWIDIEIRPNDLAYVVSTVFVQGFVQSRGGGNY